MYPEYAGIGTVPVRRPFYNVLVTRATPGAPGQPASSTNTQAGSGWAWWRYGPRHDPARASWRWSAQSGRCESLMDLRRGGTRANPRRRPDLPEHEISNGGIVDWRVCFPGQPPKLFNGTQGCHVAHGMRMLDGPGTGVPRRASNLSPGDNKIPGDCMRLPVRCSLRFPVDGDYRRRSFFGSTTHRVKRPTNAAPAMIASIGSSSSQSLHPILRTGVTDYFPCC